MRFVPLTRIDDKAVFVNPAQVVYVEASGTGTHIYLVSGVSFGVKKSVAAVVALLDKAMAVPVAMVVPNPPAIGGLAYPPGMSGR